MSTLEALAKSRKTHESQARSRNAMSDYYQYERDSMDLEENHSEDNAVMRLATWLVVGVILFWAIVPALVGLVVWSCG